MPDTRWSLPGPAGFIDGIESDLRQGRNIIVAFPAHSGSGFREAVAERVREAWSHRTLCAAGDPLSDRPAALIAQRLGAEHGIDPVLSPQELARADGLGGHVVNVHGITAPLWQHWEPFLQRYSHAMRARDEGDRLLIIVELRGNLATCPINEDVVLSHRPWRGVVGQLDMLLFASHLQPEVGLSVLGRRLAATVAAELAGTDFDLAHMLVDAGLETMLRPHELLLNLAMERGWRESDLDAPVWELGMTDNADGTDRVHSCVAALRGDQREINRRLWRAQVGVIFPVLEEHRAAMLGKLSGKIPMPVDTPYGSITDIRDLEIGQLLFMVRKFRLKVPFLSSLERLARVRRSLAHLEPASPEDLLHLASVGA